MSDFEIKITFDGKGLKEQAINPLVGRMVQSVALEGQRLMRQNAPKFRNFITRGVDVRTVSPFKAIVEVTGPAKAYADVMERGRRVGARRPPVAALIPWVQAKGFASDLPPRSAAFVLARSIQRKGIKGRFYRDRSAAQMLPFIRRAETRLANEIARAL